jgi:hypothetical protein
MGDNRREDADKDRIREKVELLTGERGDKTKTKSAVRRGELQVLASLKMQSAQISAAPTQADYNALQADVAAIFNALQKISNIYGNTELPKAL